MASGTVWLRLGGMMALLAAPGALAAEMQAPPPARERSSVQWQLIAGGMAALDGYDSLGHQGLLIASGWEFPALRFRFQFMASRAVQLEDDPRFEVRLEQYTVGPWFDTPVLESGRLRWSVGAGGGLHVFGRSAYAIAGGVDAARPRFKLGFVAGPDTSVRWHLAAFLAAEVSAAVEVVGGRPILGFVENDTFQTLHRGWAVRPRLSVALMILP